MAKSNLVAVPEKGLLRLSDKSLNFDLISSKSKLLKLGLDDGSFLILNEDYSSLSEGIMVSLKTSKSLDLTYCSSCFPKSGDYHETSFGQYILVVDESFSELAALYAVYGSRKLVNPHTVIVSFDSKSDSQYDPKRVISLLKENGFEFEIDNSTVSVTLRLTKELIEEYGLCYASKIPSYILQSPRSVQKVYLDTILSCHPVLDSHFIRDLSSMMRNIGYLFSIKDGKIQPTDLLKSETVINQSIITREVLPQTQLQRYLFSETLISGLLCDSSLK